MNKIIFGILIVVLFIGAIVSTICESASIKKEENMNANLRNIINTNEDTQVTIKELDKSLTHASVGVNIHITWNVPWIKIGQFSCPSFFSTSLNPFKIHVFTDGKVTASVSMGQKLEGFFSILVSDSQGHSIWGDKHYFNVYHCPTGKNWLYEWDDSTYGYWNLKSGVNGVVAHIEAHWDRYEWNYDTNEWEDASPPFKSGSDVKTQVIKITKSIDNFNKTYLFKKEKDGYPIMDKSKDIYGYESEWLYPLVVSNPKTHYFNPIMNLIIMILHRFPFFEKILNQIIV